jgi:hypothetical protein
VVYTTRTIINNFKKKMKKKNKINKLKKNIDAANNGSFLYQKLEIVLWYEK